MLSSFCEAGRLPPLPNPFRSARCIIFRRARRRLFSRLANAAVCKPAGTVAHDLRGRRELHYIHTVVAYELIVANLCGEANTDVYCEARVDLTKG